MTADQPKEPLEVVFTCSGTAAGKMRNDLQVKMIEPMLEEFTLATDEGPFHGGDATAPPPLALFIGGSYWLYYDPTSRLREADGRRDQWPTSRL